MIKFRPNVDQVPEVTPKGVILGKSGALVPDASEARVQCPKCGSPYLADFSKDDAQYGAGLPGFTCVAGDCGYSGVAVRS